ncbi:MAG TPA: membrane protein insertase YidC, partial [Microvirga sp.]|nr:membrane protein insertase YidC [Microvirga sp.]
MREENRNLIVAIVLSVAVLIGWQYFFAVPQAERQRSAAQQQQTTQVNPAAPNLPTPSQAGGPSAPVPGTVPGAPAAPVVESRDAALARTPRVAIDTPAI